MKNKYIIWIVIVLVLLAISFIEYDRFHYVEFNGISIKLPFIVKESRSGKTINIRSIPFDGTSLSITNSSIDTNQFFNVYKNVKGEYLIDNKQIISRHGVTINIQIVGVEGAAQLKTVYGYIKDRPFYFTITGSSGVIDEILKRLDTVKVVGTP